MKRKKNWKIFLLTFFNSSLQVFQFLKTPPIYSPKSSTRTQLNLYEKFYKLSTLLNRIKKNKKKKKNGGSPLFFLVFFSRQFYYQLYGKFSE